MPSPPRQKKNAQDLTLRNARASALRDEKLKRDHQKDLRLIGEALKSLDKRLKAVEDQIAQLVRGTHPSLPDATGTP